MTSRTSSKATVTTSDGKRKKEFWVDEVKFVATLFPRRSGISRTMCVQRWTEDGPGDPGLFRLNSNASHTSREWTSVDGPLDTAVVPRELFRWAWREVLS